MIKSLLDYSADPSLPDSYQNTALHIAITQGKSQVVKLILDYGFTHDQKDRRNMTPLMRAAAMHQSEIVDLLFASIPRQQYIDEIMLLASFYQLIHCPIEQVLDCFHEAFHLQPQNLNNSIPCEAYEFRRECQTFDELLTGRNDTHAMNIQALLVYDRLRSQSSEGNFLVSFLNEDMYNFYVDRNRFDQCLPMLIHAYNISLSCQEDSARYAGRRCIKNLINTIGDLLRIGNRVTVQKYFYLFEWILNKAYDTYVIACLCSHMFHVRNSKITRKIETYSFFFCCIL